MKLALVRRRYSGMGGAELYLGRLMQSLAARGHALHLFTQEWKAVEADVRIHAVATSRRRSRAPLEFADGVARQLALDTYDCVFSLERAGAADVYRAGDGVHREWLTRWRKHAPWWRRPFIGRGAFHRAMLHLESCTLDPRRTGRVIVNSEMVHSEIIGHFEFPADRVHLVRNGIETARFRSLDRATARARFGFGPGEFVILFAGSGWERKGLRPLRAAVERLSPGARLLVVGKGRGKSSGRVTYAGPLERVEEAYAAADLFGFLPIYEPSANVCFEARAAGLPVVTTRQNGAAEILTDGVNGSVLESADDIDAAVVALEYWRARRDRRVPADPSWDLERNVEETLAVLELAAREKQRGAA